MDIFSTRRGWRPRIFQQARGPSSCRDHKEKNICRAQGLKQLPLDQAKLSPQALQLAQLEERLQRKSACRLTSLWLPTISKVDGLPRRATRSVSRTELNQT